MPRVSTSKYIRETDSASSPPGNVSVLQSMNDYDILSLGITCSLPYIFIFFFYFKVMFRGFRIILLDEIHVAVLMDYLFTISIILGFWVTTCLSYWHVNENLIVVLVREFCSSNRSYYLPLKTVCVRSKCIQRYVLLCGYWATDWKLDFVSIKWLYAPARLKTQKAYPNWHLSYITMNIQIAIWGITMWSTETRQL